MEKIKIIVQNEMASSHEMVFNVYNYDKLNYIIAEGLWKNRFLPKKYCLVLNFGMTAKFKVNDMVYLSGDTRTLADRRNELRICRIHQSFYTAEKMSNGIQHSYYEHELTLQENNEKN